MELIDYLTLLVFFIMGAVYGWYARERQAKRTIDRFVSQFIDEQVEEIADTVVPIIIEKHNGVFFVYDKEKNDFMAQGKSRKEVEDALMKRYPDKRFAASTENLRLFNEPF